jgi:hypothetical protein
LANLFIEVFADRGFDRMEFHERSVDWFGSGLPRVGVLLCPGKKARATEDGSQDESECDPVFLSAL